MNVNVKGVIDKRLVTLDVTDRRTCMDHGESVILSSGSASLHSYMACLYTD